MGILLSGGDDLATMQPGAFWAKITGNAASTNRYSWEQIDDGDTAAFDVGLADGFAASGSTAATGACAYEVNGRTDVATGTRVLLYPMGDLTYYGFAAPDVGGSASVVVRALVSHKVVAGALVDFTDSTTWSSGVQNGSVWDGVTLATGDLILVTGGSSGGSTARSGVYEVQASGAPARAAGFTSDASLYGLVVSVSEGTVLGGSVYVCVIGSKASAGGAADSGTRYFARVGRPWAGTVRFARASSTGNGLADGFVTDGITAAEGDRYVTLNNGAVYVVQASGYASSHVPALDCPTEYLSRGALVNVTAGDEYGGSTYFNTGSAWQFVGRAIHSWQDDQTSSFVEVSSLGGVPFQSVQVEAPLYLTDFATLLLSGTGTRIACTAASSIAAGYVTTGTQTFAGDKTFNGDVTFDNFVQINGNGTFGLTVTDQLSVFGLLVTASGENIATGGIFQAWNGASFEDGYTGTLAPGMSVLGGIIVDAGSGSFVGTADNNTFTNQNTFQPATAATVPVTVQGAASQSADLLQLKNSGGTLLGGFDANGVGEFSMDFGTF